jgi:hypothetical protein
VSFPQNNSSKKNKNSAIMQSTFDAEFSLMLSSVETSLPLGYREGIA